MPEATKGRSERVDPRMSPAAKRTLQHAASFAGKTLTEFLLDSGLKAAIEALGDRRVFQLYEKDWNALTKALATPPRANPRLRKPLAREPTWERSAGKGA